jgi:prepilin-type N-terminal cleavage/methylation domain-containing protein
MIKHRIKIQAGVTLTEILTVIAIASILTAIALPALASAKESANRSGSMNNLKQLHSALTLYRIDENGEGKYGYGEVMGLPNDLRIIKEKYHLPDALFLSPCPSSSSSRPSLYRRMWQMSAEPLLPPQWEEYSQRRMGSSVLLGDTNCTFPDDNWANELLRHRALAVYEAGNVRQFVKRGFSGPLDWWNE